MKRTQFKDALRNIGKQKVSFLSIVVIALLGVTMFLGLNYGAEAINRDGTAFYDAANFRDIEVVSTRTLSKEDMEILRKVDGVKDVEGILMTQGKIASDVMRKDVYVVTAGERINLPVVLDGRLPNAAHECAVEQILAAQMGWKTGDRIGIHGTDPKGPARFLRDTDFVITGIVNHPDHMCGNVPETLYVIVSPAEFDLDVFEGSFMKAEIRIEQPAAGGRFRDAYRTSVAPILKQIETIGGERAPIREAEIDALIQKTVEDGLKNGWETLESVKESVREEIRKKLVETLGEELGEQFCAAIDWADSIAPDLTDPDTTAMVLRLTEKVRFNLHLSLEDNLQELFDGAQIPDVLLRAAFERLEIGGEYSPEVVREYILSHISEQMEPYGDKYEALSDACREWDTKFMQYLDGSIWDEVGLPGRCRWIVTDIRGNMSFVQLSSSRDSLTRLQMTFSLLFVAVGAMVIYATVSKMVDEQRPLVGTTKALGFFQREIFAKYLLFGVSATVLGTLLGMLIARLFVEGFILNGYQRYYLIDITKPAMTALPTLTVYAAGILLAFCAVWFACRRLLKTPSVALMQPEAPKGASKSSGGKHLLPLYSRLILRNIRSDLKRVIVTVVSIAGCCALVVIGITLKRSVDGSVHHQFNDLVKHDGMIRFDPQIDANAGEAVENVLREAGVAACPITDTYLTIRVRDLNVEELYCGNLKNIHEMFRLYDAKTEEPIVPSDTGIYLPKRFSEFFDVKVGDTIEITLNGTESADVRVAGIFNNYMNSIVFMSDGCFRNLFGREPVQNAFFVQLNGADVDALETKLRAIDGYESYKESDSFRKLFQAATSVMNAVVALFIFMAAVMAGVVVMNLTNIYIMQKKRELTVMRVNGFTVKEAIEYVLRETIVTTAAGILLGIGLGTLLGYGIVRAMEQPFVQFERAVCPFAWLVGAGITLLFTVVINVIVLRKVKNLKLTDAA